jgi:hypothetical protein
LKWFQHDSNARNDIKLKRLFRKYGSEGRDLYWQVVERIAEKLDDNNKTFTLEESTEDLALEQGWDTQKVDAILNCCVDLGLFDRDPASGRVRCLKILSRLDTTMSRCDWIKKLIGTAKRFKESITSKELQTNFELTSTTEEKIQTQIEQTEKTLRRALRPAEVASIVNSIKDGQERKAV